MTSAKRILALPLILLALLAQGFAPAAAAVMTARMADPLANLPICSSPLETAQKDGKAPAQPHKQLCDACSVCAGPAVAITPDTTVVAPPLVACEIAKPAVEITGPRGPPTLTPRARGPPTQA